uniref:Uncharacterized protein n=1 Tax=Anopheles albimanus TaxID=7167 RepID=A0A182F473_ANOAL
MDADQGSKGGSAVASERSTGVFSGNRSEWPTFISSFNFSTTACGYQPGENRRGSGRSPPPPRVGTEHNKCTEKTLLLDVLIERVRKAPTHRSYDLDSLISYGELPQTLCAHVQAAGMEDYLRNPMLIAELVEKLPAEYRMQWARL